MKKTLFLLAVMISIAVSAWSAPDQCIDTTSGDVVNVSCTSRQLDVNVATGTLTTVTTVGTITNVVSVDDNGGSLTVDGTVTTTSTPLTTWEYDFATVATTATGTITLSATSTIVMVCNDCAGQVNMRFDSTDASASSGIPLFPNSCVVIEDAAITTTGIRYYNAHTGDCSIHSQARR